jgi:hypothetical protein
MSEFEFNPPLRLPRNVVVFTLDDAAMFARSFEHARLPKSRDAVLRLVERACTEEEIVLAASGFRAWARAEGSLMRAL